MKITLIAPEGSDNYAPGTRVKVLEVIAVSATKEHGRLFLGVSPHSKNRILMNEKSCAHINGLDWIVEEE